MDTISPDSFLSVSEPYMESMSPCIRLMEFLFWRDGEMAFLRGAEPHWPPAQQFAVRCGTNVELGLAWEERKVMTDDTLIVHV